MRTAVVTMLGVAVLFAMACVAGADPLPGRDVLKFNQQPMIATPITDDSGLEIKYFGHDELSTAWHYPDQTQPTFNGIFMADDFADKFETPVVHVRWWGSYINRPAGDNQLVENFLIAFEDDVPAKDPSNTYPFSHPQTVYSADNPPLVQISTRDPDGQLTPQEGTFTERLIGGNPNESVYEYNAELAYPFDQKPDTVYWLKIVALVDHDPATGQERLEWGWHNRDYTIQDMAASVPPAVVPGENKQGSLPGDVPIWHFQDDAVSGTIDNIQIFGPRDIHMDQDDSGISMRAEYYRDFADGPEGINQYSKDLAFQLFTIPEPSTVMLLTLGTLLLVVRPARK